MNNIDIYNYYLIIIFKESKAKYRWVFYTTKEGISKRRICYCISKLINIIRMLFKLSMMSINKYTSHSTSASLRALQKQRIEEKRSLHIFSSHQITRIIHIPVHILGKHL